MGIRDRGKKLLEKGKRQAERARGALAKQTGRSLALQKTVKRLGIARKWTWEKAEEAQQAVEDKTKQHMGFDKYRAELETALEEAMAVIAAQEERIHLLEQRAAKRQ